MRAESASPQRSPIGGFFDRLRDLVGRRAPSEGTLRAALEELIEEEEGEQGDTSGFSDEERELLRKALGFGELEVGDVMVPRTDIKAIEAGASIGDVVATMRTAGHTRLIVYRESLDDVLGMVHMKDLLPFWGDGEAFKLEEIVRDVLPVPASMRVLDLLLRIRNTRIQMAIVVDEYGGTDGLVTVEDVVEELVGELHDEHDATPSPQIVPQPDGSLQADARVKLEDLEERLGVELLDEERRDYVHTVGGLVFALVDRVPVKGEIIRNEPLGVEFEILEADPRRVKRVRVRPKAETQPISAAG